jgi:hypothetical protein
MVEFIVTVTKFDDSEVSKKVSILNVGGMENVFSRLILECLLDDNDENFLSNSKSIRFDID